MTKISKLILGAGALGVMGIAALPVASHADSDVLVSVDIAAQHSGCTSDSTGVTGCGGNNPTGYSVEIVDKSGDKFNLAQTAYTDADTSGSYTIGDTITGSTDGGASGGFSPIAAAGPAITGENVYGLKFTVGQTGTGYYTGAIASSTGSFGSQAAFNQNNYYPVAATIGKLSTASSGLFDISTAVGENHNASLAAGLYTNTITIKSAVAN